jgi:hypothetical protein
MSRVVDNDSLRFRIKRDYDDKKLEDAVIVPKKMERPSTPRVKKSKPMKDTKERTTPAPKEKKHERQSAPMVLKPKRLKENKTGEQIVEPPRAVFTCPKCDKPYKTRRGAVTHVKKCII